MENPNHPSGKSPSDSSGRRGGSRGRRGGRSGRRRGQQTSAMRTPLQLLADLASDDTTTNNNVGGGGVNPSMQSGGGGGDGVIISGGGGGDTSLALALVGGGSSMAVTVGRGSKGSRVRDNQKQRPGKKKRKSSEVKDPPSGTPCCPICHKEFNSWKGAFGHMRKHPDRLYRGFHAPPSFTTPSSLSARPNQGGNSGEGSSTSSRRGGGILFDLNEPFIDEAGPSNNAAPPLPEENKFGFDLNELPPDEDSEDN